MNNAYSDAFASRRRSADSGSAANATVDAQPAGDAVQADNSNGEAVQAVKPLPGLDLLDGIASLALAPGTALIKVMNPAPTMKDLPLAVILSAAAWFGVYWLVTRNGWFEKATPAPRVRRIRKAKPAAEDEDED